MQNSKKKDEQHQQFNQLPISILTQYLKTSKQNTIEQHLKYKSQRNQDSSKNTKITSLNKLSLSQIRYATNKIFQSQSMQMNDSSLNQRNEKEDQIYKSQNNPEHFPKINLKQRFHKPYLENTKFVDTLIKNKFLLRRGQFEMPIKLAQYQNLCRTSRNSITVDAKNINKDKNEQSQFFRGIKKRKIFSKLKSNISISSTHQKNKKNTAQSTFTKTFQERSIQYKQLLQSQRNDRNQLKIKNQMLKLIQSEEIKKIIKEGNTRKYLRYRKKYKTIQD